MYYKKIENGAYLFKNRHGCEFVAFAINPRKWAIAYYGFWKKSGQNAKQYGSEYYRSFKALQKSIPKEYLMEMGE